MCMEKYFEEEFLIERKMFFADLSRIAVTIGFGDL